MDQAIVIPLVIFLFLLALLIILCLLYKFVYKKCVAKQPAETLPFNYCKGCCCWNFVKENKTTYNRGPAVAPVDEDSPIIVIKGGEPRKEDRITGVEEGRGDNKGTEPENKEQGTEIVPIRNEAIKEAEETANNNVIKEGDPKNNIVEAANVEENNAINGVQERKQTAKSPRRQAENYVIFTDGSGWSNRCGFGVYAGMDSSLNRCTVILDGEMSPSVAELQGMIQPLKELLMREFRNIRVVIGTDSLFTVIGLNWIQNGKVGVFLVLIGMSFVRATVQQPCRLSEPQFNGRVVYQSHSSTAVCQSHSSTAVCQSHSSTAVSFVRATVQRKIIYFLSLVLKRFSNRFIPDIFRQTTMPRENLTRIKKKI